jgi:hypothetical protein
MPRSPNRADHVGLVIDPSWAQNPMISQVSSSGNLLTPSKTALPSSSTGAPTPTPTKLEGTRYKTVAGGSRSARCEQLGGFYRAEEKSFFGTPAPDGRYSWPLTTRERQMKLAIIALATTFALSSTFAVAQVGGNAGGSAGVSAGTSGVGASAGANTNANMNQGRSGASVGTTGSAKGSVKSNRLHAGTGANTSTGVGVSPGHVGR